MQRKAFVYLFLLGISVTLTTQLYYLENSLNASLSFFKDEEHSLSKRNGLRSGENRETNSRPQVHQLEDLKRTSLPHGTFFFGQHSHQILIPEYARYEPSLDPIQKSLLQDEAIDVDTERKRCDRYNFGFRNQTRRRRRLFLGALIADDSMEVLEAVGTEAYNVFHTVSFIESNVTHNLKPRAWRFYDPQHPSKNLYKLYQLFGPNTKVVGAIVSYFSWIMDFVNARGAFSFVVHFAFATHVGTNILHVTSVGRLLH